MRLKRRTLVSILSAATALSIVAMSGVSARDFSKDCYSDTHCLAEEASRRIDQVAPNNLRQYAIDLARLQMFNAARSALERLDRASQNERLDWQLANQDLVTGTMAERALSMPDKVTDLSPAEALAHDKEHGGLDLPTQYSLLANRIVYRSPTALMDARLSIAFRRKVLMTSRNATLAEVLTLDWPRAIELMPRSKQGAHWADLAKVWLELGGRALAKNLTERAEETGSVDFNGVQRVYDLTAPIWTSLGDYTRALRSANLASSRPEAGKLKLDIARALIRSGHLAEAIAIINSAVGDIRLEPISGWRIDLLHEIVDLRMIAGDARGARATADDIQSLAREPDIAPAGLLAEAAAAFSDLGDRAQARMLLEEAINKLPDKRQNLGRGVTLGPITGSTLGLVDSLKSKMAVELYRTGDLHGFEDLLTQLNEWHRAHTWLELCLAPHLGGWTRPSEQACYDGAGASVFVDLAIDAVDRADRGTAVRYLSRAISAYDGSNSVGAIGGLLDAARVATVEDRTDLVDQALIAAAGIADRLANPGDRAFELAEVAALRRELIP